MRAFFLAVVACGLAVGCAPRPPAPSLPPPPRVQLDDPPAAFKRAYELYRKGQLEDALALFSALELHSPALADYDLYYIATISEQRGDTATATAAFDKLLRDYPESLKAPAAELDLGQLLLRTGGADQGRILLQRAAAAPDAGTAGAARYALAEADEARGDTALAYVQYMEIRRGAPGSKWGRAAKAHVLAMRTADPALQPTGAAELAELRLLVAERDWRAAEETAAALQAAPQDIDQAEVLRLLADAQVGAGSIDAAVATWRMLADRYPSDPAAPTALFRAATLLWNRDRDTEALALFEELRRRYPGDPQAADALYASGRIQQAEGRNALALQSYTTVADHYAGSKLASEARWRIGWMHYQAHEWPAAAAAFAQLARTSSGEQQAGALYWEARARERGGDRAAGRALYQQVEQLAPNGYYAMWAQQRVEETSAADALRVSSVTVAIADEAVSPRGEDPGPFPGLDTFHSSRADELRRAGMPSIARAELVAIERGSAGDPEIGRYLLRAYPGVDGYAASIRLVQGLGPSSGLSAAERERVLYPLAYWDPVHSAAEANAVDPLLVQALIRQESRFDPEARSPANAIGLMQLLPSTAQRMAGGGAGVDPTDLTNPEVNIHLGVRYLRTVLDRFGDDPLKALAAYNGGEGAVEKWQGRYGNLPADEFVESISYRETRDYVKKVTANYRVYRELYGR